MRVRAATPRLEQAAREISAQFEALPSAIAQQYARTGFAAVRMRATDYDVCASLTPQVVEALDALSEQAVAEIGHPEEVAAPPVFFWANTQWGVVPSYMRGVRTALIIMSGAPDLRIEYYNTSPEIELDKTPGKSSWFNFTRKNYTPSKRHELITGMRDSKDPPKIFTLSETLTPGTVVWMWPGMAFRLSVAGAASDSTVPVAFGTWYYTRKLTAELRTIWEQLLQGGPIVNGKEFAVQPKDAHGYGDPVVPVAESDPFPERSLHFPLAPLESLPWKRKVEARAPEPAPKREKHAGLAALLLALGSDVRPTERQKALLRDAKELDVHEPDAKALEALQVRMNAVRKEKSPLDYWDYLKLLKKVKDGLRDTRRTKLAATQQLQAFYESEFAKVLVIKEALGTAQGDAAAKASQWDADYALRFAWDAWSKDERVAKEEEAVVLDDHDSPSGGAGTAKLSFEKFKREAKCSSCGRKEIIYAALKSKQCFYTDMRTSLAQLGECDTVAAQEVRVLLMDCEAMPLPDCDGRRIPSAFREKLQRLHDALMVEEEGEGDDQEEEEHEAPIAKASKKRRHASEEEEEEEDDQEEDEEGVIDLEKEEAEDEEEEEEFHDTARSSSVEDSAEYEEEEAEFGAKPKVTQKARTAELILQFKIDMFMPDELEELEALWVIGDAISFGAVEGKIAYLRALPAVYGLKRTANDVFPVYYRKRETAELKAQQLNVHQPPGLNAYQVFERPLASAAQAK